VSFISKEIEYKSREILLKLHQELGKHDLKHIRSRYPRKHILSLETVHDGGDAGFGEIFFCGEAK